VDAVRVRDHALTPRPGTHEAERAQHAALVVAMIGTGLRIGEVLGIDPTTDIDTDHGMLKVVRQVQYINPRACNACRRLDQPAEGCPDCEAGGYVYCPPKGNDASKRTVPLPQFVLASISALQLRNGAQSIALPWGETTGPSQPHSLLFHSLRSPDKPLNQAGFSSVIARTGKRLALPRPLSPHSFRHRYTSVLANAGVPQIVIDTITGHKPTGSVTHEVYTEAEQKGIDMARDAIESAWERAQDRASAPARLHAV